MRPLRKIALRTGALIALLAPACGGVDAPRIDDPTFARNADQICAKDLPPLRADLSDDEPREPADVAPTIEARAESLEGLVRKLKAVEVQPGARREVGSWLAEWDTYIEVGRRYAEALREGDPDRYSAVANEGLVPQARISAFARTNGFKSCALDGVPLPPREGL